MQQSDGGKIAINTGNQNGYGIELESHYKPNNSLSFKVGYAWQHSQDTDANQDIADAPGQMFEANVNWRFNHNTSITFNTRWILDRKRLPSDLRAPIKDYNWSNLVINHQLTEALALQFSIKNVFDSNIREPSDGQIAGDYPMEKRSTWLSFGYEW